MHTDYHKHLLKLLYSTNQAIAELDLALAQPHGDGDPGAARPLHYLLVRTRASIEGKLGAE